MRLTKELRGDIHRKIMADLPSVDYAAQIHALVQDVIVKNMDPRVRAIYDDPDLMPMLRKTHVEVRKGNQNVPMWARDDTSYIVGLSGRVFNLQVDDPRAQTKELRDTLWGKVVNALNDSKLVNKYFEQRDLYEAVNQRVKSNLNAASTMKRLYDVLEPELHQYIPKVSDTPMLPATVAPVVDDLRKLGKNLPVVPKAAK